MSDCDCRENVCADYSESAEGGRGGEVLILINNENNENENGVRMILFMIRGGAGIQIGFDCSFSCIELISFNGRIWMNLKLHCL